MLVFGTRSMAIKLFPIMREWIRPCLSSRIFLETVVLDDTNLMRLNDNNFYADI